MYSDKNTIFPRNILFSSRSEVIPLLILNQFKRYAWLYIRGPSGY